MRVALGAPALAAFLAASACGGRTDASRAPDAGPDAARRSDAAVRDATPSPDVRSAPDAPAPRRGSLGAPCDRGACDAGLTCGTGVLVTILELDGGTRDQTMAANLCTRRCAFDDVEACGPDTHCVASLALGAGRVSLVDDGGAGLCLPRGASADETLWPVLHEPRGDAPPPCLGGPDLESACPLGCRRDADCAYEPVSVDPLVFRERAPSVALACDVASGVCRHFSSTGPVLGSACASDLGCAAPHHCWGGPDWRTPGVCVALGCGDCTGLDVACVELEPGLDGCVARAP